jgi:Mce-associated membrane protein
MSDSSRPRRPVGGSRASTGRPRGVAGQRPAPAETVEKPPVAAAPVAVVEPDPLPDEPAVPDLPDPDVGGPDQLDPETGPRRGRGGLVALVVALVVLVGVAAGEAWYLWADHDPAVSADRPVVTGEITHRAAVEAAAQAADEIVSTSWRDYDQQVDDAAAMMTDEFAQTYRQTAGDVEQQIVAAHKTVQVQVAGTGVVRASPEQVQALVFLNQYVSARGQKTSFTPYRALVTVVHTDNGWLVSDIQTR